MRCTMAKTELAAAVSVVSKALASNAEYGYLYGILIAAEDGSVALDATDGNTASSCECPALVEADGKVLVPGKMLASIVKALPDAAVTIDTCGSSASIECQRTSFTLPKLNVFDFPSFPKVDPTKVARIPFRAFSSMAKKASTACSKKDDVPILAGVSVNLDLGKLRFVATDRYRIAVEERNIGGEGLFDCVVPGKFMREIASLQDLGGDVAIGANGTQIIAEYAGMRFVTRSIEGNYPNWKRFFPAERTSSVAFALPAVRQAVKRAAAIATTAEPVTIEAHPGSEFATVSLVDEGGSSSSEEVPCSVSGVGTKIRLNVAYAATALDCFECDSVALETSGPTNPAVFSGGCHKHLVMPCRPTA